MGDSHATDVSALLVADRSGGVGQVELLGRVADEGAGEEVVPGSVELRAGMAHEGLGLGAGLEEAVDVPDRGGC